MGLKRGMMKKNSFKHIFSIAISITIFTMLIFSSSVTATPGVASWYGGGEPLNMHTANGEIFSPEKLTCAAWDYPFDTELKVTNLYNSKSVIVRVNDRGPNKKLGRAIDLTKKAFSEIADLEQGLIGVKIEKVSQK